MASLNRAINAGSTFCGAQVDGVLCQNSAQPASTKELRLSKSGETLAHKQVTWRPPTLDCGSTPGELTLHADRGSSMRSKPVALLLADLGVTKTHSRPHVSNDNPYSESQFKTLKYCPQFPQRFGSIEDARLFCRNFFGYYNHEHRHSGIGLMTPAVVHHGRAEKLTTARRQTSSKLSGLTPNDSFAEPLNLPFCLLRPGSTLRRKKQRTRRLKQRLARGGPYLSYPLFPLLVARSRSKRTWTATSS